MVSGGGGDGGGLWLWVVRKEGFTKVEPLEAEGLGFRAVW